MEFYFFLGNFILKRDATLTPITTPAKTERNKTIARDASNFQTRNEITTGIAFCTEKTVTTAMMINTIITVIIFYLFVVFHLHPFLSDKSAEDRGEDNKLKARISGIISITAIVHNI
jgi:hypothetical protein